ncbi:MAG: PTS transporter subunit EIIC [Proteobacteria bacterium]|nr:PTS transporter subunit EIIC [Pseudomonadota bacterium]
MLASLQKLGRALMLPIAVLPVAGMLLRLGQPDVWTWHPLNQILSEHGYFVTQIVPFIGASGEAIFTNLGLLFAIGVAVGFAKENHGAAGLAGLVCFLIATKGAGVLLQVPPSELAGLSDKAKGLAEAAWRAGAIARFGVPAGITSGVIAGWLYNRFYDIKLPDYLAFFGGRRFVPIVAGFAGLFLALALGLALPALSKGMDQLSAAVLHAGSLGLFLYGVLNRLLIVTGLHHILNNLAWFILGDFHGKTGDLNRFFAGDPSAGGFMSGFFPVMMFGLPAACLAMYHAAPKDRRKGVGGMLSSMALTSFLTGVTEPIEFTFMFLAPVLYGVHVVLTGLAMVIMDLLNVKLGFSFSAGLFDYLLNFKKATNPLLLIPVGLVYFAVYYGVFRVCISAFKLQTPGREPEGEAATLAAPVAAGGRADGFIAALGGPANLKVVDACTTRLRLEVVDNGLVNAGALKDLGARGLIKPSATTVQVVLGPIADQVAGEIRARLTELGDALAPAAKAAAPAAPAPIQGAPADPAQVSGLVQMLGGAGNLKTVEARASRVLVTVADPSVIDEAAGAGVGLRGVARTEAGTVHLVLGPNAASTAEALRRLLPQGG